MVEIVLVLTGLKIECVCIWDCLYVYMNEINSMEVVRIRKENFCE